MAVEFFNKLLLVLISISSSVQVTNPNIFLRFAPRKEYSPELNHFLVHLRESKEDLQWIEKTTRDVLHGNRRRHIQSEDEYTYQRQDKNNFYNGRSSRTSNKYTKQLHSVPTRPENDAFPYMYAKQYYRKKRLFDRRRKRNRPRRIESIYHRRNEWDDKPNININRYHKSQFRRDTNHIDEEKSHGINVDILPMSQEGVIRKHELPHDDLIRGSKSCDCKSHKNNPKCQNSKCKCKAHASYQLESNCNEDNDSYGVLNEDFLSEPDETNNDLADDSLEDSLDDLEMDAEREATKNKDIFKRFRGKDQSAQERLLRNSGPASKDTEKNSIQAGNSKKDYAACGFEKCKGDSVKCSCSSGKATESYNKKLKNTVTPEKHKKDKNAKSKQQNRKDSSRNKHKKSDKKKEDNPDVACTKSNIVKQTDCKNSLYKDIIKKFKGKSNDKGKCKTSTKTNDENMDDKNTKVDIKEVVIKAGYSEKKCTAENCEQEEVSTNEHHSEKQIDKGDIKAKESRKNCKPFRDNIQSVGDKFKNNLNDKIFHTENKISNEKITHLFDQGNQNSFKNLDKSLSLASEDLNIKPRTDVHSLSVQDIYSSPNSKAINTKIDELMQLLAESKVTKRFSKDFSLLKFPTKGTDESSTSFSDNDNVVEEIITKILSEGKTNQQPLFDTSSLESTSDNHVNTLDELREPTSAAEQRNLFNENPILSTPQQSTTNNNLDTTTDNIIQITIVKRNPLTNPDQLFGFQKRGAPHVKKILEDEKEPGLNANQDTSDSNIYKEDNNISSSGNTNLKVTNSYDPHEPFSSNNYLENLENYYDYDTDYDDPRTERNYNKFNSFKSRKLHSIQPSENSKNLPKVNSEKSLRIPNDDPDWNLFLNESPSRIQKRSEDDEYEEADPVIGQKVKYNLVKDSHVRSHKIKQREDENEEIIPIEQNFEFVPLEQLQISKVPLEPTPLSTNVGTSNLKISPHVQDEQFLVNIQQPSTLSKQLITGQNFLSTLPSVEVSSNGIQRDAINSPLLLPKVTIYPHMLPLTTKISLNSEHKSPRTGNHFLKQSSSNSPESTTYFIFTPPQSLESNSKMSLRHTTMRSTKFIDLLKNKFKHHKDPVLDIIQANEIGLSDGSKREKKNVENDLQVTEMKNSKYIKANENDDYSINYANSDDVNLNRNARGIHFSNSTKNPTKKIQIKQKFCNSKHDPLLRKLHLKNEENKKLYKDDQFANEDEVIKKYNQNIPSVEEQVETYNNMQTPVERNVLLTFLPLQDDNFFQNHEEHKNLFPADNEDPNSYTSFNEPSQAPFDTHDYQIIKPTARDHPFNKPFNPKQLTPAKINNFNPFDAVFKNGKYQLPTARIEPEVKYGNDIENFKKSTSDSGNGNPNSDYDGEQIQKHFGNFGNIPQYELRSLDDPNNFNQQFQFKPMYLDHITPDLFDNISQIRDNLLGPSTTRNDEWLKGIQKRLEGSTRSISLSLSSIDGTTSDSSGMTRKRSEPQVTHIPYELPKLETKKDLQIDVLNDHSLNTESTKFTPKFLASSKSTPKTTSIINSDRIAKTIDSKTEKNTENFVDYDTYDEMFEKDGRRPSQRRKRRVSFKELKYPLFPQKGFYYRTERTSKPQRRMQRLSTNRRVRRATNMLPDFLKNIEEHNNGQNFQFYNSRRDGITENPYDLQLQFDKNVRRRNTDIVGTSEEAPNDKLALAIRESIADFSNKQWSHLLDKDSPETAQEKYVYRDSEDVSVEAIIDDSISKLFQQFKGIMLKVIERESCLQLTPDQRSYLQAITSESQTHDLHFKREFPSKSIHETEPGYFMFKRNKRRRLNYYDDNENLQTSQLSKKIDYEKTKRDIKIKFKKIKRLLKEFEDLDEDSKTKIEPVEKYLRRNIRILRDLYKNVLIEENKSPMVHTSRKRHYNYDSNEITVNPYDNIKKEIYHSKAPFKEERHRHHKIAKIKTKKQPLSLSSGRNQHNVEKVNSERRRRKFIQNHSDNYIKRNKRNFEISTISTTKSLKKTFSDAIHNFLNKRFKINNHEKTISVDTTSLSVTPSTKDTTKTTLATSSPSPTQKTTTVSDEYKQLIERDKETHIKMQSDERLGMLFGNAVETDSRSIQDVSDAGFETPLIYR